MLDMDRAVERIALAFIHPWLACTVYVLLALWWLIPDRRIERSIKN